MVSTALAIVWRPLLISNIRNLSQPFLDTCSLTMKTATTSQCSWWAKVPKFSCLRWLFLIISCTTWSHGKTKIPRLNCFIIMSIPFCYINFLKMLRYLMLLLLENFSTGSTVVSDTKRWPVMKFWERFFPPLQLSRRVLMLTTNILWLIDQIKSIDQKTNSLPLLRDKICHFTSSHTT